MKPISIPLLQRCLIGAALLGLGACAGSVSVVSQDRGEGATVSLTATLRQPDGPGPHPALVLMHGCSGLADSHQRWAGQLTAAGYATLVVDSFAARGVRSVCDDSQRVDLQRRSRDAYGGLETLAALPSVDPGRIGLIGWSHGGQTVLNAVRQGAAERLHLPAERKFRAAIAFYPNCRADPAFQYDLPLLVLNGSDDDWSPAERCKVFGQRANVDVRIYSGALHSFDQDRPARAFRGKRAGWSAEATARAERDVAEFLARHLGGARSPGPAAEGPRRGSGRRRRAR